MRLSTDPVPLIYITTLYVPDGCGDLPVPFSPGLYGNDGDTFIREEPPTVTLVIIVSAPELLSTS